MQHAMPPGVMPLPDPKYLRPSIHPRTAELHRAFQQVCASGDLECVASVVNAESRDAEYLTQGLIAAIYQTHIPIIEYLLDHGALIDRAVLMAAASVKSLAIFQILLDHKWDINDPVIANETILLSVLDDETLVKWFLDHGARTNPERQASNPGFGSASVQTSGDLLNAAARVSSIAVFDMLLSHGAKREKSLPLHTAAGAGVDGERTAMIVHLIELGFDVNQSDEAIGRFAIGTPLQYAIRAKSFENVKCLLENGADAHKPVGLAGSAYKMAERMGTEDIFALLKQYS